MNFIGVAKTGSKVVRNILAIFAVDLGYPRIENLKE